MTVRANKTPPPPTDLPDRHKPRSLRPLDSIDSERPKTTMYACGYKDKDDDLSSYGMFAGPSPNLEDMLDIVPQEDTRRAYVIRFNVNGTDDELYRWNPLKEVWRRIGR